MMMLKTGLRMMLLLMLIITTAGCVSIPTGDGGSLKLSKDGVQVKNADGEETIVKIDADEGEVTYKGTDADGKVTESRVSTNKELPEGFPKDIPIPSEAVVQTAITNDSDNGKMYIVSLLVEQGKVVDYYDIYRAYADQINAAEITDASNGEAAEDTIMENIFVKKEDGSSMSLSVRKTGTGKYDDGEISIQLMYTEGNKQ